MLSTVDASLDPTFREVRLDLSAFAGSPTVQVRFRFSADASVIAEGWYVDDIRVLATGVGCGGGMSEQVCPPAPQDGCRAPIQSGRASLSLKNAADNARDALAWRWLKGSATTTADFGNPLTTTGYSLCLYDENAGTPNLVLAAAVPAGTLCGTKRPKPCWKTTRKGFAYADPQRAAGGIASIVLTSGGPSKAQIMVKGKGTTLPLPVLPLAKNPAVTIQLQNEIGACWTTRYTTAEKNTAKRFEAAGQ